MGVARFLDIGHRLDSTEYLLQEQRNTDYNIYVATTGSDTTGDGTSGAPFRTSDRVLYEISVRSNYRCTIRFSAGTYVFPLEVCNSFHMGFHKMYGDLSTVSSHTIDSMVANTEPNGTTLRVVPSPGWTPNAHIGKMVKFTSGTLNGKYGVIYWNDADDISFITQDSAFTTPAATDTFDIVEQSVTLQLTTGTGLIYTPESDGYTAEAASKWLFRDIKFTSSISAFATQYSVLRFQRCNIQLLTATTSNNSFVQYYNCYVKSSSNYTLTASENSMTLLAYGNVIDGNSTLGCLFRNQAGIRFLGGNVFSNLGTDGIQISHTFSSYDRSTAYIRFFNCSGGFQPRLDEVVPTDPLTGGSYIDLPNIYGTTSADYLIWACKGSIYRLYTSTAVTTSMGSNVCSIDGANPSYCSPGEGTRIYGSGNEADNIIIADATTVDVSFSLCENPAWVTSANGGATAITNFTNGHEGQIIIVRGGSATNSTTIADGGNFELAGGAGLTFGVDVTVCLRLSGSIWKELWRRAA